MILDLLVNLNFDCLRVITDKLYIFFASKNSVKKKNLHDVKDQDENKSIRNWNNFRNITKNQY